MIVARHVTGKIIRWRAFVHFVLIALYMGIPWLQYNGRPLFLMDIAERRFYFPGFVIWPQEFYFLMFILFATGMALFLFTALFGRIWCGWACPQTVYVELFDRIGRLIFPARFGKRSEQSWHKIIYHSVWILVSLVLIFHFVAYFIGPQGPYTMLSQLIEQGPMVFAENAWPYFWVVISIIFYLDIALFREQFCVFLCPYARFQSVMLDRDSVVIAYDAHRGEPRRGLESSPDSPSVAESTKQDSAAGSSQSGHGDCTNCGMCVQVCPTGIDIRNGLQVACINCGHCVDACTREMAKFELPTLVGYSSLNFYEERKKTRLLRPRTVVYSIILVAVVGALGFLGANRTPIHLWVIPDPSMRPVPIGETEAMNYYKLDIGNLTENPAKYEIKVEKVRDNSPIKNLEVRSDTHVSIEANQLHKGRVILVAEITDPDTNQKMIPLKFTVTRADEPSYKAEKTANFIIPH